MGNIKEKNLLALNYVLIATCLTMQMKKKCRQMKILASKSPR
ncbi:hypothetical protein [Salipaludibacillus sp. LMS25]|jgi:hypothetical protein|nr:hypothetical protein [Salipaludibacillus sp. LMS25]